MLRELSTCNSNVGNNFPNGLYDFRSWCTVFATTNREHDSLWFEHFADASGKLSGVSPATQASMMRKN